MSCRYARVTEGVTVCELLTRGGWQQLATLEHLRQAGVTAPPDGDTCPVAPRGQWLRCPCRRQAAPPPVVPVRL